MRKLVVMTVVALTALGVVGVAGASSPEKKKPPVQLEGDVENGGTSAAKDGAITVAADDFLFSPTFVKAKRGETVTVTVKNQGNASHTFTARDDSFDEEIAPGDEVQVEVQVPTGKAPVGFFCRFHESSGMQGALFTKKGSKAGTPGTGGGTDTTPTTDSGLGYGY